MNLLFGEKVFEFRRNELDKREDKVPNVGAHYLSAHFRELWLYIDERATVQTKSTASYHIRSEFSCEFFCVYAILRFDVRLSLDVSGHFLAHFFDMWEHFLYLPSTNFAHLAWVNVPRINEQN